MAISGLGVAYAAGGFVLFWSGFTGQKIGDVLKSALAGNQGALNQHVAMSPPLIGVNNNTGGSGSSGSGSSSGSGNLVSPFGSGSATDGQTALKQAAHVYGWDTGSEWTALSNVEMAEAGFNPQAKNPSSGALGLAQALGHGNSQTAGSLGNQYGGYGLSNAQAKLANSGDAYWQAVWMVNYIRSTYGDPIKAWSHEQANHWY